MAANYNNSAWFYDWLSRRVYGKALVNAQIYLLGFVPANSKVLIVGGGTGWILEELTKIHPSELNITYVEVAAQMTELSKKRNTGGNRVIFINDAVENVELKADFDIVITPFLLDNFTEQTLNTVFDHINSLLKREALWLNASFQFTGKWWQKFLLKAMFLFFKAVCGIEASRLPAIKQVFDKNRYIVLNQKTFFGEFVLSSVYKK